MLVQIEIDLFLTSDADHSSISSLHKTGPEDGTNADIADEILYEY